MSSGKQQCRNVFVGSYENSHTEIGITLQEQMGFERFVLNKCQSPSIPSKKQVIKGTVVDSLKMLRHWKVINHTGIVVGTGYLPFFFGLMQRLHLLDCKEVVVCGFFLHSPGMIRLFSKVAKVCCNGSFRFMVFSCSEGPLYAEAFGLPEEQFLYLPYGDWSEKAPAAESVPGGGSHFFSGGYSNRDYVRLVQLFQDKPWPLVIAASRRNADLVAYEHEHGVSSNISIVYDTPPEEFGRLLECSRAVLFLMKDNTGASGQMVVLQAMRSKRLIISSTTDILSEYVEDGESAIVVDDVEHGFTQAVERVYSGELGSAEEERLCANAYARYQDDFSAAGLKRKLVELMGTELARLEACA